MSNTIGITSDVDLTLFKLNVCSIWRSEEYIEIKKSNKESNEYIDT